MNTAPILVVGNGPAGLVASLTLLKNGIPVRIIDKRDKYHSGQRGSGIQPRSLELYSLLGVPEIAQEAQLLKPTRNYGVAGSTTMVSETLMFPREENTPSKPFANSMLLGQHRVEEILRGHVERYGVFVELNTELASVKQDSEGVTAQIIKNEGGRKVETTIWTPFLIGADGAKGVSRKQLGFEFDGVSRPTDNSLLGDMYIKGLDPNYWHRWGEITNQFILFRPTEVQDLWAVVLGGKVDFKTLLTDRDAFIRFVLEATGRDDLIVGEIKELNEWSPNIRMVKKFGEGRCFIVGDAAHVHSPTGGQGMNSSIQDSINLCWKLALVYKGLATPSLLSSYTSERVPVIQEMLQKSTKMLDQVLTTKANDHNTPAFNSKRPRGLDQLGVNCRWSKIVVDENRPYDEKANGGTSGAYGEDRDATLRAGDRAPDAPGLTIIAPNDGNTSLFKMFRPDCHTALIFVFSASVTETSLQELSKWPKGTVQSVVILPNASGPGEESNQGFLAHGGNHRTVVVDSQGHAYNTYGSVVGDGFPIIIVRPDGVIGAIVKGSSGISRYYQGVFQSL